MQTKVVGGQQWTRNTAILVSKSLEPDPPLATEIKNKINKSEREKKMRRNSRFPVVPGST